MKWIARQFLSQFKHSYGFNEFTLVVKCISQFISMKLTVHIVSNDLRTCEM